MTDDATTTSTTPSTRMRVVVVARDGDYRLLIADCLAGHGYDVVQAADRAEALQLLEAAHTDAVVADVQATGAFAPLAGHEDVPVVIIASKPTAAALRGLRMRAVEVLVKPVSPDRLVQVVALAASSVSRTGTYSRASFGKSTSRSAAMQALLAQVERLRDADCPVLILGETGTGKTVLARRIHAIGARSGGPFVDLNCAGLTPELVESELFGHERGSFTGAHAAKQGLFDAANDGTLFLDEIGDIDLRVQPRVLKVLEEKRFRRMGDVRERLVDVRLIAATHQDLLGCVASKTFRADLYYRISTIRLTVPPLRERREDIVPLALEMLDRGGHTSVTLSRDAEQRLLEYPWPGNIRELKNVIESSTLLAGGTTLTASDLRFDVPVPPSERALPIAAARSPSARFPVAESSSRLLAADATDATRAEIERAHIRLALTAENGRVEAAARRLGIPRSTLYWKLKRYGLRPSGEEANAPLVAQQSSE